MTITNNRLPNKWQVVTDDRTTDAIVGKTFELKNESLVRVHLYYDNDEWHVDAAFQDEEDPFMTNTFSDTKAAKREARRVMHALDSYDDRVAGYHRTS